MPACPLKSGGMLGLAVKDAASPSAFQGFHGNPLKSAAGVLVLLLHKAAFLAAFAIVAGLLAGAF